MIFVMERMKFPIFFSMVTLIPNSIWLFTVGATRPRQIDLIKSLWNNALRYSTLLRIDGNHFRQSQAEHRAMVDYACKGDIDGACGVLKEHLSLALNKIVSIMQENHDVE